MPIYSKSQIDRANQTDLAEFLRSQGETLIRSGREYRWKAHDSLTIRGNLWYRHSRSKGGTPISFVMEFYNRTFPEALRLLLGEAGEGRQEEADPAPLPEFRLPMRNGDNEHAIKYLTKDRCLSDTLVSVFLQAGDIYEEAGTGNVVFVGRSRHGTPFYAHIHGTGANEKLRQDVKGSNKAYNFCHVGTDETLYVFEAPIDLLSFLDLYPNDWQKHSYLSLGGVAGKALEQFLADHPNIRQVFLCLDSDTAGNEACLRLLESIPEKLPVTRLKPALKDWNELLKHPDEAEETQLCDSVILREPPVEPLVPVIRVGDVKETPVDWLWKPYIPFGKLTILQGNPGEGKTYFATNLVAACTNRAELPFLEPLEPFNVIYQSGEDGVGDTLRPRLREAGADLNRVLVIDEGDSPISMRDERLRRAIRQNGVRLLILDPLQTFIGEGVDMNRANEVRPILRSLAQTAEETNCAVLLIGHLNKATGMQSTYRGLGSIDLTAIARSILFIGKKRDEPNLRVLTQEKSSLAPPGKSLAFHLGDEEGFRWIGEYEATADEILSGVETRRPSKTEQAKELLESMLAGGKEVLSEEIDRAAEERGISARTVRDAKNLLGDRLLSRRTTGKRALLSLNEAI